MSAITIFSKEGWFHKDYKHCTNSYEYKGDLFVGAATPRTEGGYLFHFNLTGNRRHIGVDDPRLEDLVADNLTKHDITESESLLIGRNFGVVTDIVTGPNGNLYVLSISNGTLYEVYRTR